MEDYTGHPDYPAFVQDYVFVYGANRSDMSEHDFALWRWATNREREACAQVAHDAGSELLRQRSLAGDALAAGCVRVETRIRARSRTA